MTNSSLYCICLDCSFSFGSGLKFKMGVRGLQTFIEKECPEACKTVSIQQLAHAHKMNFNCSPALAVDGYSMTNRVYCNSNLEWIYGGQWLQFVNLLENIITNFKNIGVELIFFFDGTVTVSKMDEWVKRRLAKCKTIAALFKTMKQNFKEPDRKDFQLPTSMGILTACALKLLGAKVYGTDREADEVIAEYAFNNPEVFAVLSQDSDFIIYNTKPYLSLNHLDLGTLYTVLYDRNYLASHCLNINVDQLPLFACLVGNDFVPQDKLKPFHKGLTNNGPVYLAAIASHLSRLIQDQHWSGSPINNQEHFRISQFVFGHGNWANLICDGLNSYIVAKTTPSLPELCVNLHPNVEMLLHEKQPHTHVFNLLCTLEYRSSEVMEDTSVLPSSLIYREIRQRGYGVLFSCFSKFISHPNNVRTKYGKPIIIKEWCAYHCNYLEKPEFIPPLPLKNYEPRDNVPSLEEIWLQLSQMEKMRLFWAILQIPMEFEQFLNLPGNRTVFACILNFLIDGSNSGPHLKPWEVAVFVAQAVWKKNVKDLEQLTVPWVDAAAVNLSTLFMRGVTTILMVLTVCNDPFPVSNIMPWQFFDGKLFHYLYTSAQKRCTIHELLKNQADAVAEFYKLLPIVVNNTRYDVHQMDWRNVLADFDYNRL